MQKGKVDSEYIINLNVKCETIKLLEERIGENLCDFGKGREFLGVTSKAQSLKKW